MGWSTLLPFRECCGNFLFPFNESKKAYEFALSWYQSLLLEVRPDLCWHFQRLQHPHRSTLLCVWPVIGTLPWPVFRIVFGPLCPQNASFSSLQSSTQVLIPDIELSDGRSSRVYERWFFLKGQKIVPKNPIFVKYLTQSPNSRTIFT